MGCFPCGLSRLAWSDPEQNSSGETIDASGKTPDGKWIDANTGEIFEGQKHRGHVYGHENRRILKEAEEKGMSQKELNDKVNSHPEWFQIEKPSNNVNHKFEKPGID
ncbi:MAG: GH-E family nuclease [Prolixibacteraceae bacterium]|nr:GH-E family nuclease [Prolixibacteraceae bacterium]